MLETLAVLRGLLQDGVVAALDAFLARGDGASYAQLAYEVFECREGALRDHVVVAALDDENAYVRALLAKREPSALIEAALDADLALLEGACVAVVSAAPEGVPSFPLGEAHDFAQIYHEEMARLRTRGFGKYAHHAAFYLADTGDIVAVRHPDPVRLGDLVGYEREKDVIIQNTRALLSGLPAANILLTGDAGTGKSSTVKAVANELASEGLRILEVRKDQLHLIPALLDELTANPLSFILFIDDLSFSRDDDNYAALKAILEGSVAAKSPNVVVYATSNRRHLVKERFSEREGDDIHRNDTMQEVVSLSERFGIHVTFSRPNKDTYLGIVSQLAIERGMSLDERDLELVAERFALRNGGRSARRARQFVDALSSGSQKVRDKE